MQIHQRKHSCTQSRPFGLFQLKMISLAAVIFVLFCIPLSATTWTNVNGVVCVEIEGQPANGKWVSSTSVNGFSGSAYYCWDNNNATGVVPWRDGESMTYTINITQAGNYQFLAKGLISYGGQRGEHNDAWLKLSGTPISGEWPIPTNSAIKFYLSNFGWTYHSATKDEDQQPIRQYFSAGIHTVKIAGRSSDYCIDRFMLIHSSRWDELLKDGISWNDNPSWGASKSTLDAIAETLDNGGPNIAPLVDVGEDKTVPFAITGITLNASVSDDGKPGGPLTYSWTQVNADPIAGITSAESEDTGVTLPDPGTYVFRLTVSDGSLSTEDEVTVTRLADDGSGPLAGQIIVDPIHGNYFVRNQDLDSDGSLDPFMMAGVGGPEQFLYLGTRQSDGTRSGGRQQEIIDELIASGANGIYLQSIRSFGGDAGSDSSQAPFNTSTNPDSGLDPDIMAQWHGWFTQMRDADIGILFFIYDDHAKPWGSSGDAVPAGEASFLTDITNEFEGYPNIIFVMAEEYQFAGFSEARMKNMAAVVAAADDHGHAIGVHHNIGLSNQFIGDANIKVFVQQADLRNGDKMAKLHDDYGVQQGFDEDGRYAYVMGEGFGYHQNLVGLSSKRDELRRSMYATAMAGGVFTVFGAYESAWGRDPLIENLEDMGRVVEFFHSTPFNTLIPDDSLAHGDTDWVLAKEGQRYIAYSQTAPASMGVKGLPAGSYDLRWFDAKEGEWVLQNLVIPAGDTAFTTPSEMNNDTVLEIIRTGTDGNQFPTVNTGADIQIANTTSNALLDATVTDDGQPSGTLTYLWTQESGPATASISSPSLEDTTVTLPVPGEYVFRLTASDGELSQFDEVSVTRLSDHSDVVYAINCGGGSYTATDGTPFEADNYFTSGDTWSVNKTISGTSDETLFRTERYIQAPGTVNYAFPVNDGTYEVVLMWSENTGNGRIMDVFIEGLLMIDDLDVVSLAGGNQTAYLQSVEIDVSDGLLDISIEEGESASERYPNVMAIIIKDPEATDQNSPVTVHLVVNSEHDATISLVATIPGTYILEYSQNLTGSWDPVEGKSVLVESAGDPVVFETVVPGGNGFYRVRIPD